MGFLDDMTAAVSRGTASAERKANTIRLKRQIADLAKQRKDLAAQLGASLYEVVATNPDLSSGREPLVEGIAEIDRQRAELEAEIERIESEDNAAQAAAAVYDCPRCGERVEGSYLFCSGCGLPIEEVKKAVTARDSVIFTEAPLDGESQYQNRQDASKCFSCGAPMPEEDLFCMHCGAKREPEGHSPAEAESNHDVMQFENACEYPPDYKAE